jgi:plasmid stabilization system protein ParE
MADTRPNRSRTEAASKIAHTSMEAGTEAARKVQDSLKSALDALTDGKERTGAGSRRS